MKVRINYVRAVCMCAAAAVLMARAVPVVRADEGTDYKTLYEDQKKRNDDLEKRVGTLEQGTGKVATATAPATAAAPVITQKSLDFLGQTEISGFAEASYL